jgi:hypothetical protein
MLTLLFVFLREAVSEPRIPVIRARVATEEEAGIADYPERNGRSHGVPAGDLQEVSHLGHT